MRSVMRELSAGRQRQVSITAGRDFFMPIGVVNTSRAPFSNKISAAKAKASPVISSILQESSIICSIFSTFSMLSPKINTLAQAKPLEGSKDNSVKSEKSMSDKGKAPEKKQDNRKEKKNVKPSDPKKEEKGRINKDKKNQNDKNKNNKKDNKDGDKKDTDSRLMSALFLYLNVGV